MRAAARPAVVKVLQIPEIYRAAAEPVLQRNGLRLSLRHDPRPPATLDELWARRPCWICSETDGENRFGCCQHREVLADLAALR